MVLVTLVIENVDYIVADFIVKFNTSSAGIILFVIISVGYILGQTILMKFMNSSSSAIKSDLVLIATLHRAVSIVHTLVFTANVILIIIQILVFSRYSIINLICLLLLLVIFLLRLFLLYSH